MLPFLPLVSFAAVAMGMLNARERFRAPALAPATFNIVAIVTALVLWRLGLSPEAVAVGWSIGVVLGGFAQLSIQLPALAKDGWREYLTCVMNQTMKIPPGWSFHRVPVELILMA